jgi:hypothetical protein
VSKFDGSSGKRPSAEARRYVYDCFATTLAADLDNGSGYIFEDDDLDEFDVRRIQKAVKLVIKELRRKTRS